MPHSPLLGIKPTQPRCIELVFAQLQVPHAETPEPLGLASGIGHREFVIDRPESADVKGPHLKSVLPILNSQLSGGEEQRHPSEHRS
jgi:hypothetical protein